MLNLPVKADLSGLERASHAEFRKTVLEPSCCFALRSAEQSPEQPPDQNAEGTLLLEICPEIAYVIIDRVLGGSSEGAFIPTRGLTGIERRLLRRIALLIADNLSGTFPTPGQQKFRVLGGELSAGEETALVVTLSLTIFRYVGSIRLCIPQALVATLAPSGVEAQRSDLGAYLAEPSPSESPGAPVEVTIAVEGITLSPDELAHLDLGDVVTSDTPVDGEVIVRVAGVPKFAARLGTSDGRRGIIITRRIDAEAEDSAQKNERSRRTGRSKPRTTRS
jgi:flagellar motor switch protein FliM